MSGWGKIHARDHSGRGSDPIPADWIYIAAAATAWSSGTSYSVGDIASHDVFNYIAIKAGTAKEPTVTTGWQSYWRIDAPFFQNSWANSGSTRAPLRFRYLPGMDSATSQPSLEIQGSIAGGTAGATVFTLPITLDYDVFLVVSVDGSPPITWTVKQSGDVVDGVA